MMAAKMTTSRLRPLIFIVGIALGLVAFFAMVLALTWTAVVAFEDNAVFAESPSANQPDPTQVSTNTEGSGSPLEESSGTDPTPTFESNGMAVWLTWLAMGLSSDSSVSYLTYAHSLSPPDGE